MSLTSPKIEGVVNINYVVMSILNRLRDYSMRHYHYLFQLVIEGYTELSLYSLRNIEVVYKRMSDAKTVDLPADFVDYTKIGVPINGKIRVLTNKEEILLPRKFADGQEVGNTDAATVDEGAVFFVDHFRNGQFIAGMYGMPGGIDTAYYRIDWERRQIVFGGTIASGEVVIEYISSGVKTSGSTLIPREAVAALRSYVFWQMIDLDSKVPMNEKQRRKQNFLEEEAALRYFQNSVTKEEYERHVWKHTHQTPKR